MEPTSRNETAMRRLAILGAGGYVGSALTAYCDIAGINHISLSRRHTHSSESLHQAIIDAGVDHLINCAGYTGKPNVDACELHKAECLYGNSVLPGIVRDACERAGIPWGHVSSGCVFSGRRPDGDGFREEDPPNFSFRQNNCSFYSGCKALGEEILVGASQCYIWRLRIPFDNTSNPRNYLQKLLSYEKLLDAENSLSNISEFVEGCCFCLRNGLPFGTYNLTNPGSVTTRQVVELIKVSGVSQKNFSFFEDEKDFMAKAAKTPRSNCVLDSTKAINAGVRLTPIIDSIQKALSNWQIQC